jgi:hypothetical protein
MEQETLPAIIDQEQFGNLVNIPRIVNENTNQAARAVAAIRNKVADIKLVDITTVDANQMELRYQDLQQLIVKGKNTLEVLEQRRKPYTSFFDSVRKLFTTSEKEVTDQLASLKEVMDSWQREKARRAAEAQRKLDQEIADKQEAIRIKSEQTTRYTNAILIEIGRLIGLMNQKFNQHTIDSIDSYAITLRAFLPVLSSAEYEKLLGEATPLASELFGTLSTDFVTKLTAERDRLLDLIPSRKAELERMVSDASARAEAEARLAKEAQERAQALETQQRELEEQARLTAEAETMNATFDLASEATPVVGITKGTVVKKKYKVTSQAAMIALLQSYIKYNLPLLTIEEMNTKFSFVRTAADKRLSDGEVIQAQGLEVVEDFSTRATRKTA